MTIAGEYALIQDLVSAARPGTRLPGTENNLRVLTEVVAEYIDLRDEVEQLRTAIAELRAEHAREMSEAGRELAAMERDLAREQERGQW